MDMREASVLANNTTIKAVVLSGFIKDIPDRAFAGCSSLEAVYCPGVTSIGNHAFDGCVSLESFTVPYEITNVGEKAFVGVGNLIAYVSSRETATNIVESGARNIVLNISKLSKTSGLDFRVGKIDSFELDGNGETFSDLTVYSAAATTHLDGITASSEVIALDVSSNTMR